MTGLWRHQAEALAFILRRWREGRKGSILALWMGTGKTRVAIVAASGEKIPLVLVLCPLAAVEVWREQFARWAPEYHFLALDGRGGTVAQKAIAAVRERKWAAERGQFLAIAVNYDSARLNQFAAFALRNVWPLVIYDEVHKVKSPSGATSRFCRRLALQARRTLGLTGTLMPHSPLDVWAPMRMADASLVDVTYSSFRVRYAEMDPFFPNQVARWKDFDGLAKAIAPAVFQVGPEVLDLPGERDQFLYCALGEKGRALYRDMEEEMIAWVEEVLAVTAANPLVRLLRLAQIANGSVTDESGAFRYTVDTAKRDLLEDLLDSLPPEEPVVVFGRFRSDLEAIHHAAGRLGRASGELSGERGPRKDLPGWKRGGPGDPVILAVQIQAGSVAIDLTRARYAVYYAIGYSLADYLQSRARIYRAGQTRPVMFYHLLARDTVDQSIRGALERRQDLVEGVIEELRCQHPKHTQTSRPA